MLKLLLKKQLAEVFRGYFYNQKKNKPRSKAGTVGMFLLFGLLMLGVMGGLFSFLSVTLCAPLLEAGMGWLYFLILSGAAVLLGAFGSVFNTYSGLYLAKDNDFLLSLPIPVKYIIASRLLNVFLLGTMYSAVAILPALIVYWMIAGVTAARVICGVLLMLSIFLFVMVLSCLLGWCVAKISVKLKNKSIVTVLASLLFLAVYYVFYFKAKTIIQDLIANAASYGEKIRAAAKWLYLFGRSGEGDYVCAAVTAGLVVVLLIGTWFVLKKTFLSIALATGTAAKKKYVARTVKAKSPFGALLSREFAKFTATPSYMLNCGLGLILVPALGVFLLLKGADLLLLAQELLAQRPGLLTVVFTAMMMMLASVNDISAPSVSLEGKNIWIAQSLPVSAKTILSAKAALHLILSGTAMLFTLLCTLLVMPGTAAEKALFGLVTLLFVVFTALFGTFIGVKMANLKWTNEIIPIKQSGAVTLALFGGWIIAGVFAGAYFLFASSLGAVTYLGIWAAVLLVLDIVLKRLLDTKGAAAFARL